MSLRGIERFFNCDTFSDLTVQFSGRKIKVHKIILCSQSKWFAKACEGPFKEGLQPIIDLYDDPPLALEKMLEYFYGEPLYFTGEPAEEIAMVLELYAVADKYDVLPLRMDMQNRFHRLANTEFPLLKGEQLINVISLIYECTPAGNYMRKKAVQLSSAYLKNFKKENPKELREMLERTPEFSADLVMEMIENGDGLALLSTSRQLVYGNGETSEKNFGYRTRLHDAVHDHHLCSEVLAQGEFVDALDWNGYTPLVWAAYGGHLESAKLLVDSGALINFKCSKALSRTALGQAKAQGHEHVVAYLESVGGVDY